MLWDRARPSRRWVGWGSACMPEPYSVTPQFSDNSCTRAHFQPGTQFLPNPDSGVGLLLSGALCSTIPTSPSISNVLNPLLDQTKINHMQNHVMVNITPRVMTAMTRFWTWPV